MKIIIETIPHSEQRYPTVGDYWDDEDGTQHIVVSEMANEDYDMLVAIHELIEKCLTKKRGISEPEIKAFDEKFEKDRVAYQWSDDLEPGDSPNAPYRKEHFFATTIERLMAAELKVDWERYDKTINELP